MNPGLHSSVSGTRSHHNPNESRGDSMFIHAELAAYLECDSIAIHSQSLTQDVEAGPALAYRQAHGIE
jgi:hypothetical protein